ncbi:MAG: hypothetical protein H6558_21535 [Lewinellaceae bacterium]|nr:hypothetical protein [Lewinellaceae bacterium]
MRNIIILFCLFLLGNCSGGHTSEGQESSGSEDTTAVEAEKEAIRPAHLSRRNRIPFEKTLKQGPVTFRLSSPNVPEENTLVVAPSGLEVRNDTFQIGVAGLVTDAQLADLDKDGFPEVYAFARSSGPDSTAYVYPFASYRNRSYGIVSVTELQTQKEMAEGFQGHGRFFFEGGVLKRSFPIYQDGQPSGKNRVVTYGLQQGEASFVLAPVSSQAAE